MVSLKLPDCKQLAWEVLGFHRDTLYVATLGPGAVARERFRTEGRTGCMSWSWSPWWSPNSEMVAVPLMYLGNHVHGRSSGDQPETPGTYVVPASEGKAEWLINGSTVYERVISSAAVYESGHWSPDSRYWAQEVWEWGRQLPQCVVGEVATGKSWVVSGTEPGMQPAWAPDSKRLVFVRLIPTGKYRTYDLELWTVKVDGTGLRRLVK